MSDFNFESLIVDIPDYPEPGVVFKDITPLFADPDGLRETVVTIADHFRDAGITKVVGPEARGFIVGVPVAMELGAGFIPARKPGKLPRDTYSVSYELEYGTDSLEIHKDAIKPGQKVVVIDDLIATGGTIEAAVKLIEELGGEVVKVVFLMELAGLKGRERLKDYDVESVICYEGK